MRVSRSVLAVLAFSSCLCFAQDSSQQVQSFANRPLNSDDSGLRLNSAASIFASAARPSDGREFNFTLPDPASRLHRDDKAKKRVLTPDETCFTMRSYVVEREDPESDAVRPKAYSTCQPSSRYDLRDAVAPLPEPSLK